MRKIGESKPHIQRWMKFLSDFNNRLSYRRGRGNTNANFLSRLPLSPTVEDISDSSALSDPDDLGVYVIRACNYLAPLCPPKRWPGWAGPLAVPYPMYWARWIFHLAGYSGLGWATPDERRLPDTPCPDASTANDRSHHPPFRGSYLRIMFVLNNR